MLQDVGNILSLYLVEFVELYCDDLGTQVYYSFLKSLPNQRKRTDRVFIVSQRR